MKPTQCPHCGTTIDDPSLGLCTHCWKELPEASTDALRRRTRSYSTLTDSVLIMAAAGEREEVRHTLPWVPSDRSALETQVAERTADARAFLRHTPYELQALSYPKGWCRLFQWHLVTGQERGEAVAAGLLPLIARPLGPPVPIKHQARLQQYLPAGVHLESIPTVRARCGRRWRQGEITLSEWEQDRDRYLRQKASAFALCGTAEGTAAWTQAEQLREELRKKYGRAGRKCRMCQNFLPVKSRALYCTPACKERAKARSK